MANGRLANRLYPKIDSQPGHVCDEINVENFSMVAGEPRHIIADLTAGPSHVVYELGCMLKLNKCSTEESGKLAIFALAEVEQAIPLAIGAG
jgi:hypothetical protein